ncbi:MAG: hypothetical protein WCJ92_07420 [Alphaproteobacteria bacterium]
MKLKLIIMAFLATSVFAADTEAAPVADAAHSDVTVLAKRFRIGTHFGGDTSYDHHDRPMHKELHYKADGCASIKVGTLYMGTGQSVRGIYPNPSYFPFWHFTLVDSLSTELRDEILDATHTITAAALEIRGETIAHALGDKPAQLEALEKQLVALNAEVTTKAKAAATAAGDIRAYYRTYRALSAKNYAATEAAAKLRRTVEYLNSSKNNNDEEMSALKKLGVLFTYDY